YCSELPFQSVGRLTWKRIGGAFASTGAIAPITWQYSGSAGAIATSGGGGPNGTFGRTASGEGATSTADSMVAPPVGRPMEAAGIACFSASQAALGSTRCPAQAASSRVVSRATNRIKTSLLVQFLHFVRRQCHF